MRTVDFSPLFRSAIGFDRLFDLAEAAQRVGEESYPPYNIERLDENNFQISVALAGFRPDEVELTVEQNVLRGPEERQGRQDFPASRHLGARLQAPVHARRPCRGQGCPVRERAADHRPAAGNPRSDEAAPDRNQRRDPEQRHPDRVPGGLIRPRPTAPAAALPRGGPILSSMHQEATMRPTTAHDDNIFDLNYLLHPGTTFEHPRDVVSHPSLSLAEKRAILASWASDASAIASCPSLRAPGLLKAPVSIDDILEALCALDEGPRHPPGGKPMRLRSVERRAAA
jgi:hypothetical protein